MFNFNPKNTAIDEALWWEKFPVFRFRKPLKKIFFWLFLATFLLFLYGFVSNRFSVEENQRFFGGFLFSFAAYLFFRLCENFFLTAIARPKLKIDISQVAAKPEQFNLADYLSLESQRAVKKAIREAEARKTEANATILLDCVLEDNPALDFIFQRLLLNRGEIREFLARKISSAAPKPEAKLYSSNFENSLLEALWASREKSRERIEINDLFLGLVRCDPAFREIMINGRLKVADIESLIHWLEFLQETVAERKRFWERKNLKKLGSLAKDWAAGYTVTLDKFSIDITEVVRLQGYPKTIGHKEAVAEMERILSKESGKAALIIGEPGSGRKSMVWDLARKSALGESLPGVNYKRIVQLDLTALLAQAGNQETAAPLLDTILKEIVYAGNIILVIDELHSFVGQSAKLGTIDISGILSSYLTASQIQMVGLTTFEGLHRSLEQNPSFLSYFGKVEVTEISERETLMLLENLSLALERKYKKFISFPALRDIIVYCAKYMAASPFPEKAMTLLEELAVYISQTKEPMLLPEHVAKVISEKTKIPVGDFETREREVLLHLEELIHQRIINQEEAVEEVSSAMRRARAEVVSRKGTMGNFLFLGPTGVGKTETSKALAEIYFGTEERMIRLDMSEFQNLTDIRRLIGAPGEEGLLTTAVRENSFSLILLDEIEKTHPNILNLFLQVLDEGHLTDGMGRGVDFKNTIIIATSNAGYQIILEALKTEAGGDAERPYLPRGTGWVNIKERLLDYLFANAIFRPEFINRFDAVVVFNPLSKENLLAIAALLLGKIKKSLAEKDIEFIVNEPLKEKIVELSYNPVFGAREMKRVIQDKVENVLATALLSGQLKRGNRVEVEAEDFRLKIV
ncbi:MAG: hypothetical protein COT34_01070 [Candidatus Nealsonbacteria bacterium CG08_land_8_20_14_0_20_43_11]|uniref:Clp R domain-containing protein n=1 Tax=Candidatus Nealsonbacteria bacterium CG08_land_8_20_14_0_20_43_11 TaxID=1974706 RepID=A0A2M6T163_9BACT|nr:MAG: hypothetical protein COT34_01070 [Candidatus Nealsonbacteria bacterium CG08_land_8_20_14_0_20_43_11]